MSSLWAHFVNFCHRFERCLFPSRAQERNRHQWEAKWSRGDFAPQWSDRGVAPEIVEAVKTGWLPPRGTVLDIGCGLAEIAAWFAERDYSVVAFDIAKSAIEKARAMHSHLSSPPEYMVLDICAGQPPNRQYSILIDRGCLHQIPSEEIQHYVRNVSAVAASDARFLLFTKAFRDGQPFGDPAEKTRHAEWVGKAFAGVFAIERVAETYLDRYRGKDPSNALPGLVFWLRRTPAAS
jgi:SAM-dependent methyltransferase